MTRWLQIIFQIPRHFPGRKVLLENKIKFAYKNKHVSILREICDEGELQFRRDFLSSRKVYRYISSQKWDSESTLNTSLYDKNL